MVRNRIYLGVALVAAGALGYCLHPSEKADKNSVTDTPRERRPAAIADQGDEAEVAALRLQVQNLEARLADSRKNEDTAVSNAIARVGVRRSAGSATG